MSTPTHLPPAFAASRRDARFPIRRGGLAALLLVSTVAGLPAAALAQDTAPVPGTRLEARAAPDAHAPDAVKARLETRMAEHAAAFSAEIDEIEAARLALIDCRAEARRGSGDAATEQTRACHAEQAAADEAALDVMATEADAITATLADARDSHLELAARAGSEAGSLAARAEERQLGARAVAREIRALKAKLAAGEPLDAHLAARLREQWQHLQHAIASLERRRAWAEAGAEHHRGVAGHLDAAGRDVDLLGQRLANASELERWYLEELAVSAEYRASVDQGAAILAATGGMARKVGEVLDTLGMLERDTPVPPETAPALAARIAPADQAGLEAFIRDFDVPDADATPALAAREAE